MGITVLIARFIGEKRPERISSLIGGAAVIFVIISCVLFVVMVCFANQISVLMQAPAEAVSLTSVYVRICGAGIFFIVAYNVLAAIFRGLGDSKSPLIFVAILDMDAAGAAAATVLAQAVSVVLAVLLCLLREICHSGLHGRISD